MVSERPPALGETLIALRDLIPLGKTPGGHLGAQGVGGQRLTPFFPLHRQGSTGTPSLPGGARSGNGAAVLAGAAPERRSRARGAARPRAAGRGRPWPPGTRGGMRWAPPAGGARPCGASPAT